MEKAQWQGKIAIRSGMLLKRKFAAIYSNRIDIHKGKDINTGVAETIRKQDIKAILPPKTGVVEIMFTGYKGFVIEYTNNMGKPKKIGIWPVSMLSYLDSTQVESFASALGQAHPESSNTLARAPKDMNYFTTVLISTPIIIVAWYFLGGLGVIIMGIAVALSVGIYKNEKFSKVSKILLIAGLLFGSFVLTVVIQLVLIIALDQAY